MNIYIYRYSKRIDQAMLTADITLVMITHKSFGRVFFQNNVNSWIRTTEMLIKNIDIELYILFEK